MQKIIGINPVTEALRSDKNIEKLEVYKKIKKDTIKEMFDFISKYEGEIPGATEVECGNYLDQNLPMARYESKKFLEETLKNIKEENLNYPD